MSEQFPVTNLNQVKRVPKRGSYDHESVFEVIDAAWIAHVGILNSENDGVAVIPMLHARMGDEIVLHGANSSRLMKYLAGGQPVCLTFSIVDGLVLAKSLFHHSMNYRSAVVFGSGGKITDADEIITALTAISDKVMPGRWNDARQPNAKELSATALVKIKIDSASAKVREGEPSDDPEDLTLPVWSGVVPIVHSIGKPETDQTSTDLPVPDYVREFVDGNA